MPDRADKPSRGVALFDSPDAESLSFGGCAGVSDKESGCGSFNRCVLVDGEIAGGIGLSATGLFGYWLGVRYHGRGIATRAVKLFLQEVPQYVPDCGKLIACVYEPNVASTRVLEKCGFTRVGFIEPQCAAWDGNVYRGIQFELEL